MTTFLYQSWDHHERPALGKVGKNGKLDFDHPEILADVHAQHERLHDHQEAQGYSFPPTRTDEWEKHPVRQWTGSRSPDITRYWLGVNEGKDMNYGGWPHVAKIAHALDDHLHSNIELGEHVFAYSGISHKFGDVLSKLKPGQVFYNPSPISTSISPGLAFKRSGANIISLSLPKGSSPGVYAGKVGGAFEHEHELVLKRQTPLVLVKKTVHTLWPEEKTTHNVFHFEMGQ